MRKKRTRYVISRHFWVYEVVLDLKNIRPAVVYTKSPNASDEKKKSALESSGERLQTHAVSMCRQLIRLKKVRGFKSIRI